MRYTILSGSLSEFRADAVVEGLFQEDKPKIGQGYLSPELSQVILAELKRREFDAKEGEVCVLPLLGHKSFRHLIIVGVGKKRNYAQDQLRSIGGKAIKAANSFHARKIVFHSGLLKRAKDLAEGTQALVEGVELGGYHFTAYHQRTAKEQAKKHSTEEIVLLAFDRPSKIKMEKGIFAGKIFADATILARDMVNTPAMDMHPDEMVRIAKSLSGHGTGVVCKVLGRSEMEKLGMRASLAVGQGSVHEPKFVHLVYKSSKLNSSLKLKGGKVRLKKIALVGKALTFDSGGLSLKPDHAMTDMKMDMAGAAAVLGVFQALSHLKLPIEVHGLFIAAENMPSGSAYRPGDVVAVMDGTTIEVENTDAEGRITLADALSYAAHKIKPDTMIDLATLTGAVIIALGSDVAGLFCANKELKSALQTASVAAGEPVWELPLYQPYKELIKSKIADVKNVGGRTAGIITAALFLEKFVSNIPWAHLDIAGPAYAEKETRPEWVTGGTGWGVRLLLSYLKNV